VWRTFETHFTGDALNQCPSASDQKDAAGLLLAMQQTRQQPEVTFWPLPTKSDDISTFSRSWMAVEKPHHLS